MKKVSIIIPLYNLEKLIGKCIASALGQDLSPEEYEILVIDDGSTDGSLAAAEKAAQGHPNVHVYTKPNEGLSRTRNYGTDRAAGRYVMYLDADDYLEPNVLGRLVETMECGGLRSGTRTKSSHPARCITHGGSNTSPSGFTTTCNAAIRSWAITSRKVA